MRGGQRGALPRAHRRAPRRCRTCRQVSANHTSTRQHVNTWKHGNMETSKAGGSMPLESFSV
eukprot:1191612-Prorocentrum_minimum.AAC.1